MKRLKFLSVHFIGGAGSDLWVPGLHAKTFPDCHRECLRCFVPGAVHMQEGVDQCIKFTCVTRACHPGGKDPFQDRPALTLWP